MATAPLNSQFRLHPSGNFVFLSEVLSLPECRSDEFGVGDCDVELRIFLGQSIAPSPNQLMVCSNGACLIYFQDGSYLNYRIRFWIITGLLPDLSGMWFPSIDARTPSSGHSRQHSVQYVEVRSFCHKKMCGFLLLFIERGSNFIRSPFNCCTLFFKLQAQHRFCLRVWT